ncbi:MAG TPA: GspH/FimT family pseudopilin [Gemmatimonadales bacterium]|jgi:prepilin-type N-terminal cleavage/methylation domain-containing protein
MRRGFTLAEMLVVLAILGITAAAVVPAFGRATQEDAVTRTARDLEGVLLHARATALARAVPVCVTLVPATGRYWTVFEADGGRPAIDSGAVALTGGVRLQSPGDRATVRFGPLGVVDGDSLMVLGPTGAWALVLDRWTGEVHVEAR